MLERGRREGVCWNGESGEKCKFIVSLTTGAADQSADGILAVAISMCV